MAMELLLGVGKILMRIESPEQVGDVGAKRNNP
jgi:hypothetical protein